MKPLNRLYTEAATYAGADPIECGLLLSLADNECAHERLPFDPTPRCGCWREERPVLVVVPDLPDRRIARPVDTQLMFVLPEAPAA